LIVSHKSRRSSTCQTTSRRSNCKQYSNQPCLDPPTGPQSPKLTIKWYRQDPHDWFRINYTDPNTGFHAGWHQDEDHPELGRTHFQYSAGDEEDRWGITFNHQTPSLILWEIVEELLEEIRPTDQYANEEP
jgi:hypothetical protein